MLSWLLRYEALLQLSLMMDAMSPRWMVVNHNVLLVHEMIQKEASFVLNDEMNSFVEMMIRKNPEKKSNVIWMEM